MMEEPPHSEKNLHFVGAFTLGLLGVALITAGAVALGGRVPPSEEAPRITDPFADIEIRGKAAIVIDIPSGDVLYQKNADVSLPLASLTKTALALVVAETLPLDSMMTVPYYASGSSGIEHLLKGDVWQVQDVIDFTLVTSSNNGAEMLAELTDSIIQERYPEAPEHATVWRMNQLANDLGLEQTAFFNASGLDLSTTQAGAYGSAHDMAKLFAYAASAEPSLFAGTARNGVILTSTGGEQTIASNTNSAQGAIAGLIMGKTGFTDLAGGNLAVVFDIGLAHPAVAVVLGSSEYERFEDIRKLVTAARKAILKLE